MYTGEYVLRYNTEEETKNAYENLKENEKIRNINVGTDMKLHNVNLQTIIQNVSGKDIESWGIYAMGLNETQDEVNNENTSDEIVVAVIDSGFDLNNTILTEQNLTGRIDNRYINVTDNNNLKNISDLIGHGTHVGGIILDGTPNNVKILPIKIADDEGDMDEGYLNAALQYAIEQDVDVINLSLGGDKSNSIYAQKMKQLIAQAVQNNITVVAAVGNGEEGNRISGENKVPASISGVIGVAAVKTNLIKTVLENKVIQVDLDSYSNAKNSTIQNLEYTEFSNYGSVVDFAAPGEFILSLVPTASTLANFPVMSGTSQASPHIAAAVATIKSYKKELTNDEVYEALKYYAQDMGTAGKDQDYGEGFVSFKNYKECECGSIECYKIYCTGCANTECIYHTTSVTKTLTGIEVTTQPSKTVYTEGEIFDRTGMVITAKYSDNTSQEVTNYTWESNRELQTSDTQITITYTEGEVTKTTTINITVNAQTLLTKTLTGIEVTTQPSKTVYTEGEIFDKTGMVITAIYNDGTRAITDRYSCFPTGKLTKENTQITITYTEGEITKTTTINITVNAIEQGTTPSTNETKKLSRIKIVNMPDKTTYTQGEKFDKTGMIINAVYADETSKEITNYTCSPETALTTNDTQITITYTEGDVTKTTSLLITVQPVQTSNNQNNNNQISGNQNNNNTQNSSTNKNTNNVTTIPNTSVQTKDNTTTSGQLAYTGLEDYIILTGGVILALMAISYIGLKKYKGV